MSTSVAPVKLLPLMVIRLPLKAVVGVKELMTGAGVKVKVNPALLPVPPAVVTLTLPLAPEATTA